MKCKNCGAELQNGVRFCLNCGAEVVSSDEIICPYCNHVNSNKAEYCNSCGLPLKTKETDDYSYLNSSETEVQKKSILKPVLIIGLVFIFLMIAGGVFYFFSSTETEVIPEYKNPGVETDSTNLPEYTATMMSEWPFYDYYMRENYTASSSSVATGVGAQTYYPDDAIDNDHTSTWIEGSTGQGTGEWIALKNASSTEKTISEICFLNGNADTMESFNASSTPAKIELSVGNSSEEARKVANIKLNATPDPQEVTLSTPINLSPGESLIFTISEVSNGLNDSSGNTAISDIRLVEGNIVY